MSTISLARIEANQRNAALSTGPRTPEGKSASRANSLKHGLIGTGVVSPTEDLARIAEVAQSLRQKYRSSTPAELDLADHAATLLVRLQRASRHELAMIADNVADAVLDFNQARRDWADQLFEGLATNPAAIHELGQFPEGLDRLVAEWHSLDAIDDWSTDDLTRVAHLLGPQAGDPTTIRDQIPLMIQTLEVRSDSIDRRPIDRARQQAADLALFPTSREAILARRYEAATERAYHKAIQILEEIKAASQIPEVAQTDAQETAMASLLPELEPTRDRPLVPSAAVSPVAPEPPVDRARRPDLRKLREAKRRKGR